MKERILLLLAVFGCFVPTQVYKFCYAAYHQSIETPIDAAAAGFVAPLVLSIFPIIVGSLFRSDLITRALAGTVMLYGLDDAVSTIAPMAFHAVGAESMFIFMSFGLLVLCLFRLSSSGWRRIASMVLGGSVAWACVLPVSAWWDTRLDSRVQMTLSANRILNYVPVSVAIVILDEASPENLSRFKDALSDVKGMSIHAGISIAAGRSTVFSIPSMLTDARHDDVVTCSSTQLCGRHNFNMKNLRAVRSNTDVVGTFHPYCSMQGLRSCWTAQITNPDAPIEAHGLVKAIARRLPVLNFIPSVAADYLSADNYFRDSTLTFAFKAPFWTDGGTLYIHYLLPHPTVWPVSSKHLHDLAAEYEANGREAAEFLRVLNGRLWDRFGYNYALIVTSDHSLRTAFWCAKPFFRTPDCIARNSPYSDYVPFLVVAASSTKVTLPTTNVGIFTPLPENG